MYAVIETGGKQYRVAKDQEIAVERLSAEPGATVSFEQVLLVEGEDGVKVGAPLLEGAKVSGEVVAQSRTRKIIVFKKKRRQNYRRRAGHRQHQTVVRITGIDA
ncbi:MAG: 50S ribosomal protein L21 [Rhodospirillales bacterium]